VKNLKHLDFANFPVTNGIVAKRGRWATTFQRCSGRWKGQQSFFSMGSLSSSQ